MRSVGRRPSMHQTASILFTSGALCLACVHLACASESTPANGSGGSAGAVATSESGSCHFAISAMTADQAGPGGVPTVGIVDWSVDGSDLTEASIEFGLPGAP